MSQVQGYAAEQHARDYLLLQGLSWVASNYRCRLGEIDLIMRHGSYLVFVEVRARASLRFGGAVASVTRSKQQKLVRTASLYLQKHKLYDKQPVRFDVLSIEGVPPRVSWIQDAFGSER